MTTAAYTKLFQQQTRKAIQNLTELSHKIVPTAGAKAANVLKRRVMTESLRAIESDALIEKHHIQRRFPKRLQKAARVGEPAIIHAKLSDFPVIELLRQKGKNSKSTRATAMALARLSRSTPGVTLPGRYPRSYPGAFIADGTARLNNPAYNQRIMQRYGIKSPVLKGNVQVMKRTGKAAYPVEVVKIPLERPMRQHLRRTAVSMLRNESPTIVNQQLLAEFQRYLRKA